MTTLSLRATALAAVAAISANTAFAQEVTLRFQHFVSPASGSPMYFMEPWAEKIERESDGRIKVEIYPLMQLAAKRLTNTTSFAMARLMAAGLSPATNQAVFQKPRRLNFLSLLPNPVSWPQLPHGSSRKNISWTTFRT